MKNKKASFKKLTKVENYFEVDKKFASSPIHPVLKSYFGYCLFKAAQRMRAMFNEGLGQHGIVATHFGILVLLDHGDLLNQVNLGNELGIDKASMVKMIDDLEKNKLVVRESSKEDRRVKMVKLTKKGKEFVVEAFKIREQCEQQFLKDLSPEEIKAFKSILPKLVK